MKLPDVTVCVPVYNAAGFVEETLQSICRQTYPDLQVMLSVDRSDDGSADICRNFDHSVPTQIHIQKKRLNLAGNINFLLDRVDTRYFCVLPCDDLIEPEYLETLVTYMNRNLSAVIAYTDIECFGLASAVVTESSVLGSANERMITFLKERNAAVPFRGLIRRGSLSSRCAMKGNRFSDFAADTAWLLQLACLGEFHRVDVTKSLYYKRMHKESAVRQWVLEDQQWHRDAWFEHCLTCAEIVIKESILKEDLPAVLQAIIARLIMPGRNMWPASGIAGLGRLDKEVLSNRFLDLIADWPELHGIEVEG